jgi:Scramblase
MQRALSFPGGRFVVARLIANSSYLRGVGAGELSLSRRSRVASRQYASSSGQSGVGAAEKARLAAQQRAVARRVAGIDAKRGPLPPSLSFGNKHPRVVAAQGETGSAGASRMPSTTHLPAVSDAGGAVPALSAPALVVTREFEFGNIFFGFEQANKYTIRAAPGGLVVGFIAEIDSMGKSIVRNVLRTHRSFKATVFDKDGVPVFEIRRPAYLISTNMYIHEPGDDGAEIGQIEMAWHPWKRRYRLFTNGVQFAECDTGFLGVDFEMKTEEGSTIARVNKDFTGFARELFTDARQYVIRLDSSYNMTADGFTNVDPSTIQAGHAAAGTKEDTELGWKERAVILARFVVRFDTVL